MRALISIVLACALGLAGCATPPREVVYPGKQDLPGTAEAGSVAPGVNSGIVITRQWEDVHKTEDGGREYVRVQIGYDYDRRQAFWNEYSMDGELLSERYQDWMPVGTSEQEMQHAFELALAHPKVARQVENYDITLHGGFQFMEAQDPHCGHVSRCVHVFAFDQVTEKTVAHSIVDLLTNQVVYPVYDYDPDSWVEHKGESS